MIKVDEPYNPEIKRKPLPFNIVFRLIKRSDFDAIVKLSSLRNPTQSIDDIKKNTDKEITNVETDPNYQLYVCDLNGEIIGFCRFYNCASLPESKRTYPAPDGWYGMGIMVAPNWRRHGIANFMTINRFKILKERGIQELYSIVDAKNLTSIRMHESFGFQKIKEAKGFLHVKLESGKGYLFMKII
jgi:ribosomal protein S18 acetylase RimI-like enzyme